MGCQAPCAESNLLDEELGSSQVGQHDNAGRTNRLDQPQLSGRQLNRNQPISQQNKVRSVVYGPDAAPNGFTALSAEWNKLLQQSRYNTIFLSHEWQTTWWQYLGEGDLWIVAFYALTDDNRSVGEPINDKVNGNSKGEITDKDNSGKLVGIIPLYLKQHQSGIHAGKRVLTLVGCIEVSDYLDAIIARDWEKDVHAAFLDWLHKDEAPLWDVVDLCNLPEDSLTYRHLAMQSEAVGLRVTVQQEDVAPQFVLPLHYETYMQDQVEKKQRHEIRRKQRRAEREAEVGFYFVGKQDNLEAEVDDFVALQRASREDKAEFMTPEMRRFFGAVARNMMDAGYLRLCFLTLDGQKSAVLFAFEYDRRFLLYNSGYDPEDKYAHLSPGWVLLAYSIQYAIASGCRLFDFMQGDEEYKYRFGSQDYKVMRVIIER